MPAPNVGQDFEYVAKEGETVIRNVRIGHKSIDMGKAYVIKDRYEGAIDEETVIPEEDREAEAEKLEEAFTNLNGILQRMLDRSDKIGIQIQDVYEHMLNAELKAAKGHQKSRLEKFKKEIIQFGKTAEAVTYAFYNGRIKQLLSSIEGLKDEDGELTEDGKLLQKPLGHSYFFLNTIVNSLRGQEFHSLDRIRGNLPQTESVIPVKRQFEVGDLGFLKNDDGHGTKVHSIIRCYGTSGDHTEILAKGVRIAVANTGKSKLQNIKDGQMLIVDGRKGIIIKDPAPKTIEHYQAEIEALDQRNKILVGRSITEKTKGETARTLNNQKIVISANLGFIDEMYAANLSGARSVGLYRSEIDIKSRHDLDRADTPLKKFVEIYDALAKMSIDKVGNTMPITIRTPDMVADKSIEGKTKEDIDLLIENCIRGVLIAQKNNPAAEFRIMFPMIETAEQFNEMRNLVYRLAEEIGVEPPQCGAMIETKSAIQEMKKMDADFYSIGTNDLIPDILGYERYENSEAYDPTDPKVMQALLDIQENAAQQGKANRLSICGDVASQPMYFAMLVGMGYNHLSTGPGEIPFHKELVRRIDTRSAEQLVERMKKVETREEREQLLKDYNEDYLGLSPTGEFDMEWEKPPSGAAFESHHDDV